MMLTAFTRLSIAILIALLNADRSVPPRLTTAPNTITGLALDTHGKPLAGARIEIARDFTYGKSRAVTGADGRYVVRGLVNGTYRAFAYVQVPFDGQTICMRLLNENPADENSFAVDRGAVRNFQWRLTGALGVDGATVGASLRLANSYLWYRKARAIELTFTPQGPLLDGTPGAAIVREVLLEAPASDDGLVDIPLGRYTLQATRIDKDGHRAAIRLNAASYGTAASTLALRWRSSNRCGLGSNSGVETLPVWLEPPT